MNRLRLILSLGLLLFLIRPAAAQPADPVLRVATVQFSVREQLYLTPRAFAEGVEGFVGRAAAAGAELVVFPEYINVFLLFAPDAALIRQSDTLAEAMAALAARPETAETGAAEGAEDVRRLMRARADSAGRRLQRLWSSLAREYEISIVAGTYFARTAAGGLRNRALVFDDRGRLVHQQDKAFLTPFEAQVLGLEAGPRRAVETFEVEGVDVGMTICRDSFFEVWDERLAGAEVLVELRANGEPYSHEVRRRFEGALPERVIATEASAGINSSLTGTFLDLLWEGPSYVVDAAGRRIADSGSVRGSELLVVDVEIPRAE